MEADVEELSRHITINLPPPPAAYNPHRFIQCAMVRQQHDILLYGIKPKTTIGVSEHGIPFIGMKDLQYNWNKAIDRINQLDSNAVIMQIEGLHMLDNETARQLPTNKKYVFLSNMWWDRQQYTFPFEYYVVQASAHWWFNFYRMFLCNDVYFHHPSTEYTYTFEDQKPFMFSCLAGAERPARTVLVDLIKQRLNYKNYIGTYEGIDFGSSDYVKPQWERLFVDPDIGKFQQYGMPNTDVHPALKGLSLSELYPISTFNLTRLALVVETSITYNHSRFLTEKTFKPLVSGQPFVIYGAHNHLKNLRDHYGFRTYHELWDEGYDELWDHTARANAIIDLLNSLEHFDWKAAEPKLKEIANHNFRNILHLRDIYSNESINELDNIYNFVYNTV